MHAQVKSKIKDHVAYYRHMQREKSNPKLFDKEPQMYVKEPRR